MRTALVLALTAAPGLSQTLTVCEQIKLGPPEPIQYFGSSLDVDGDTLVSAVGGDIYVHGWDGSSWVYEAKFGNTGALGWDWWARQVDVEGDTLVAGTPEKGLIANPQPGRVNIYERQGTTWSLATALTSSTADGDDWFGHAVSLSGDTLAVGAPLEDDACPDRFYCESGAVYVYRRTGATWVLEARLLASDMRRGDNFGWDVALDGDVLAASATDSGPQMGGGVYVFERQGGVWTERAALQPSSLTVNSALGADLDIDGRTIVAGDASNWYFTGTFDGVAYVFGDSGGTWAEEDVLIASDTGTHAFFGGQVDVEGDRVLVAASLNSFLHGAAYLFERDEHGWRETAQLRTSDSTQGDAFAEQVVLTDEWIAGNSNDYDPGGVSPGAIYFFDTGRLPATTCHGGTSAAGCRASLWGEGWPGLSTSTPFELVAAGVDGGGTGLIAWSVTAAASPFRGTALCIGRPLLTSPATSAGGAAGACDGELRFDFNQWMAQNPGQAPGPGETVHAQAMFTGATGGPRTLSDAFRVTVCP